MHIPNRFPVCYLWALKGTDRRKQAKSTENRAANFEELKEFIKLHARVADNCCRETAKESAGF